MVLPDLVGYEVNIRDSQDAAKFSQSSDILSNTTTTHTFSGLPNCRTYIVEIAAINAIGRSSPAEIITSIGKATNIILYLLKDYNKTMFL